MANARRWVAATAASVLGIGVIATSAIGVANAMPLVESTQVADVPPITTVPGDQKGSPAALLGAGSLGASASGAPSPAPTDSAPTDPAPTDSSTVAPAPQPVAPQPAVTDSAASVPSPASVDG